MFRPLLAIASIALCTQTAQADESAVKTNANLSTTFESIDRNADHRISRTEAGSYQKLLDRFASIDADGDGFVTKSEFDAQVNSSSLQ
jgi:Ca2+-binding EF-hand superfamily protein